MKLIRLGLICPLLVCLLGNVLTAQTVIRQSVKRKIVVVVPDDEPTTDVVNYFGSTTVGENATVLESVPDFNGDLAFDSFMYNADGSPSIEFDKFDLTCYEIRLHFETENGNDAWIDYLVDESLGFAMPVSCSNNTSLDSSFVSLSDKGLGGQGSIYIEDSTGVVYRPETPQQLENVLVSISVNGRTVTTCILKGHGSPETISPFDDGDHFITCAGGNVIISSTDAGFNDIDITGVLNDVTDSNSTIRLRGCFTKDLADDIETACGGEPDVKGAIRFVIGVPFTDIGFGVYR